MHKLCLLIFCLGFSSPVFSQCKNSIAIRKISDDASKKKGVLDIEVVSVGEYSCVLNIEKGSGSEQVQKREGRGNAIVHFEGLDPAQIYMVQVVFLSENNPICRKLQKSQIIIDAE